MTKIAFVLIACLIAAAVTTSCGSGRSAQSCAKEVDDLSADVAAATKMTDLSTSTVKDSLSACGGPEEWKASAPERAAEASPGREPGRPAGA